MLADDVVLKGIEEFLRAVPGLEDHVTLDEESIPPDADLPWCWLQLGDFNISGGTMSGKKFRTLAVNVDLITKARFSAMQAAGDLAEIIENRVDADPTLGRLVTGIELTNGTRGRDGSIARLRLSFVVNFSTVRGAAGTPTR